MNIVEFAEDYLQLELKEYQKNLLWAYHNCGPGNNLTSIPIRSGKTLVVKIIMEYERTKRID